MRSSHLIYFVLVVGVFFLANICAGPVKKERTVYPEDTKEKAALLHRINTAKPDIVLIGNSMLDEGVSADELSSLLGKRVEKIAQGGTASAWWYLIFKNIVLRAAHKPDFVVFFFRDYFLTEPDYRTTGNYRSAIELIADVKEPLLDRLVFEPSGIERYLNMLPLYNRKHDIRKYVDETIKNKITAALVDSKPDAVDRAVHATFNDAAFIPALLNKAQLKAERLENEDQHHHFKHELNHSFLPAIIELANEQHIKLLFVRIKRRRYLSPDAEDVEVQRYIADLRNFLSKNHAGFIDFTHNHLIGREHFGHGDHLNREKGRPLFTRLLAENMRPIIDARSTEVAHSSVK